MRHALAEAVAPEDFRARPWHERDRALHVDPADRTVRLLLPRGGRWRVRWWVMQYAAHRTAHAGGAVVTVCGVGDGPNDLGMLEWAGFRNGLPSVVLANDPPTGVRTSY